MALPFEFTVSLPGQQAYTFGLQRFADEISDWRGFWDDYFRDVWYRHITTHYTTQGRSTGAQWAPLSDTYGVWKQKHWPGLPVGVLSGALRSSLTFPDDPDAIWEAKAQSLTVGTRVPYALYLQYGTKAHRGGSVAERHAAGKRSTTAVRRGGMPARPPLRINDNFMLQMGKLLQEYAVKTLRKQKLT